MPTKSEMILQELVRRTNDSMRRLRALEDKIQNLEKRTNSLEETNLDKMKKVNNKFLELDMTTKNLSDDVIKIKNNLEKINKQITKVALKRDIKEIENMLDLLSSVEGKKE